MMPIGCTTIIPEIEVSEDDHVGRSGARQRRFQGVLYDPQLRHSVLHRRTGQGGEGL